MRHRLKDSLGLGNELVQLFIDLQLQGKWNVAQLQSNWLDGQIQIKGYGWAHIKSKFARKNGWELQANRAVVRLADLLDTRDMDAQHLEPIKFE